MQWIDTNRQKTRITLTDGKTKRSTCLTVYGVTPKQMRKVIEQTLSSASAIQAREAQVGTDSGKDTDTCAARSITE